MRDVRRLDTMATDSKNGIDMAQALLGRRLLSIERRESIWAFGFDRDVTVITETLWRLLHEGVIARTSEDDEQMFGLAQPVNAATDVRRVLSGNAGVVVEVSCKDGDLHIRFSGATTLQFLQTSSGYEAWHLNTPTGEVHCLGGGTIHSVLKSE
jgi:hypothetical protein